MPPPPPPIGLYQKFLGIGNGLKKLVNKVYYVDGGSHSQFLQWIFTHNSKNLNTSLPMNIRGKEEEEAKEAWTQISSQSRHWFPSAGRAAVSAALLKLKKNIKQKV